MPTKKKATEHTPKSLSDEVNTLEKNIQSVEVLTGPKIFIRATLLALFLAFILLLITGIGFGIWGLTKVNQFLTAANLSFSEAETIVDNGIHTTPKSTNFVSTFLVLGVDSLDTRPGSPELTDTMMLIYLNYAKGTITMVPLPRDTWNQEYQTKINALYHYGKERYPESPEQFPTEVIEEMTRSHIDYTVVVTMDQVGTIIDMLGGISIDVPVAFTDEEFPRPDVDVTVVTDPELLYQTVSFEEGEQTLDGERSLQYIRSRKSGDNQGSDTARANRQQLVVEALVTKLQSPEIIKSATTAGSLLRYYLDTFDQYISIEEVIGIGVAVLQEQKRLSFISKSLSTSLDSENPLLINPPVWKYNVWVWEVADQDSFRNFFTSLVE